ncbi:MAG: hypothetical protein EBU23_17810, partial [Mycobacteriaceae bacterium]|nr:hypothetical protein [Mycobacteriaceae bacterium]
MASVQYAFGYSNTTAVERQPIPAAAVWQDIDQIPPVAPLSASGVVAPAMGLFTSESDPRFPYRYTCSSFANMVPANYWFNAYTPTLRDARSQVVAYDSATWVADS